MVRAGLGIQSCLGAGEGLKEVGPKSALVGVAHVIESRTDAAHRVALGGKASPTESSSRRSCPNRDSTLFRLTPLS